MLTRSDGRKFCRRSSAGSASTARSDASSSRQNCSHRGSIEKESRPSPAIAVTWHTRASAAPDMLGRAASVSRCSAESRA
eukprot:3204850-Prymnesium_polylepis.1